MSSTAAEAHALPILRTKLWRPRITGDLVQRPRLEARLEQHRHLPLTLVVAPAGFGKTTLVSSWLEAIECPSAWLSLDEDDDHLAPFVTYLVAAVRTILPDACSDTLAMVEAGSTPPLSVVAGSLIDELDQTDSAFVLVLDDFHLIRNMAIHDLLTEVLRHPPRKLHLVIASRSDPYLPLNALRARGQMAEVRAHELRFTQMETAAFLEQATGIRANDRLVGVLTERIEGWVAGLRLLVLSLRHRGGAGLESVQSLGSASYVADYLVSEVLQDQPPVVQDWLLQSSVLDQFCAPLCEAVCLGPIASRSVSDELVLDGGAFVDWLVTANLFVTRLDDRGEWVRFHSLFRELLGNELRKRLDAGGVSELHRRACAWYAKNGYVDEALDHALAAGDSEAAANLVIAHRHEPMNREHRQVLGRWLSLLPRDAIEQKVELLLSEAWILHSRFRFRESARVLGQAGALLGGGAGSQTDEERQVLSGELAALRSVTAYWAGQGQVALDQARYALEHTPIEHEWVRGIALTYYAGAFQLVGQLDRAYEEMHKVLADGSGPSGAFAHRAVLTEMAVEILAGNLQGVEQAARRLLDLAEPRRLYDSVGWAHYALGFVYYQRNQLDRAIRSFSRLVEMRYQVHSGAAAQGFNGLALAQQAAGALVKAQETSQAAYSWASVSGESGMVLGAESLASRLALLRGEAPHAYRWAGSLGEGLPLLLLLHIPQLTLANALLTEGAPGQLRRASNLLSRLRESAESTHNTYRILEITAMEAILAEASGKREEGLGLLRQAIAEAEPRGFVRLFADLGPRMARLLAALRQRNVATTYVDRILSAFGDSAVVRGRATPPRHPSPLIEPLTNRELEVLALLAKRLTNKEIAAHLVISVGTVKQHVYHINQKLNAKGRRDAVAQAVALGVLAPQGAPGAARGNTARVSGSHSPAPKELEVSH